jgi:hypothetical protein
MIVNAVQTNAKKLLVERTLKHATPVALTYLQCGAARKELLCPVLFVQNLSRANLEQLSSHYQQPASQQQVHTYLHVRGQNRSPQRGKVTMLWV